MGVGFMLNDEDIKCAKEYHVTAYITKEQQNIHSHHIFSNYITGARKIRRMPAKYSRQYIVSLNGIDYYKVYAHSLKEAILVIDEKVGANPPSPNPAPLPPGQTKAKARSKVQLVQSISAHCIKHLLQNNMLIELNDESNRTTGNSTYENHLSD